MFFHYIIKRIFLKKENENEDFWACMRQRKNTVICVMTKVLNPNSKNAITNSRILKVYSKILSFCFPNSKAIYRLICSILDNAVLSSRKSSKFSAYQQTRPTEMTKNWLRRTLREPPPHHSYIIRLKSSFLEPGNIGYKGANGTQGRSEKHI